MERIGSNGKDFKERLSASVPVFNIVEIGNDRTHDKAVYLRPKPQGGRRIATYRLAPREFAVLHCITEGMTNKEITNSLFISIPAVKNYCRRIFIEFDCQTGKSQGSRTSLISKLIKEGVLTIKPRIPETEWVGLKSLPTAQAA